MLNNIDFDFSKESKKKKKEKHNNNDYENNEIPSESNNNILSQIFFKLKIWFNSITFIVKQIVAISIILCIIDLISFNNITFIFTNVPYYSIGCFQIWRFITGNLITSGIFSLIFALIFWVSDGKTVEKINGSAKYLIYFLIHSSIIQIIYALIYYFFINKTKPEKKDIHSAGLWIYIICEVTINCLISPETKIYLPLVPYAIKSKFFPIIILLVFFIFGGFYLGMFIAVAYGFIYSFFLNKYLIISDEYIINFEQKYFKYFFGYKGYIKLEDISPSDKKQAFLGNLMKNNIDNNRDYDLESKDDSDDSEGSNPYNKNLKKFIPFTGK